jgi:hypothetical protein
VELRTERGSENQQDSRAQPGECDNYAAESATIAHDETVTPLLIPKEVSNRMVVCGELDLRPLGW